MEAAAADEEQEGLSAQSPAQAPPSSASSLPKDQSQVELELRLLQALEFYPPSKLKGQKPRMRASIYTSMAPASMTGKKLKPAAAPGEFGSAASPSHVAVPD